MKGLSHGQESHKIYEVGLKNCKEASSKELPSSEKKSSNRIVIDILQCGVRYPGLEVNRLEKIMILGRNVHGLTKIYMYFYY